MTGSTDLLKTVEILKANRELTRCGVPYSGAGEYVIRKEKVEHLVKNAPSKNPAKVAAYYLKNLPLLQPFPDGNHRTALIVVEIFLNRTGHRFEYTTEEAEELRDKMLGLQLRLYGTYEELPETVTREPDNELYDLCMDFIKAHTKSVHGRTRK